MYALHLGALYVPHLYCKQTIFTENTSEFYAIYVQAWWGFLTNNFLIYEIPELFPVPGKALIYPVQHLLGDANIKTMHPEKSGV